MNSTFKKGDIVKAFGLDGVVSSHPDKLVRVEFENGSRVEFFQLDGRFLSWHKEPSLHLVSRVTKEIRYPALYRIGDNDFGLSPRLFGSKEAAIANFEDKYRKRYMNSNLTFVRWLNEEKYGVEVELEETR